MPVSGDDFRWLLERERDERIKKKYTSIRMSCISHMIVGPIVQ